MDEHTGSANDNLEHGCQCGSLADLAVVPMGCDGLDQKVFSTLDEVCDHGGEQWWLYLSRCRVCGQNWMIAQEERIYDDYFLKRVAPAEAQAIAARGDWPEDFITYERVLTLGRELSAACVFFDELSPALAATAEDLLEARPEITDREISELVGVDPETVARLGKP